VKERELDLERQAHLDPLTGVGNRRLLHIRLACALADRRQGDSHVALALVDLDHFKGINDRYGHAADDAVLTTVARRLSEAVRADDTVARVGGDEFVVLCPTLREGREADILFARLAEQFNEPFPLDEGSVTVAASIGLVLAGINERAESLLARADAEMYCAKVPNTTPMNGLGRRAVRAV
jgi:diguanylate cyclase (GGDEF)-like protein